MKTKKDNQISDLFAGSNLYHYKKGEILIRPDTPPAGVYLIAEGYVKIYSLTEDGQERLHIIYKPGDIFPLIWSLEEIQKDVFYEAITDVVVQRVAKSKFISSIKENPQVLFELTRRLSDKFNIFIDRVENLEITQSYPRLVYRLLVLAERFGTRENKAIVIKVPLSHRDIANSIAMSRETASRDISKLEKKDIISYKNHFLIINDLEALKKELSRTYTRELP